MVLRRYAVVFAAVGLAAAPAAAWGKPVSARISPHGGHPGTVFRVGFTAPKSRSYTITLELDGSGHDCATSASRFVAQAKSGERAHRRFVPENQWCRGRWIGTVYMADRVPCDKTGHPCSGMPGPGVPIGGFRFRVRNSSLSEAAG
jgi:hypothetical protein